MNIVDSKIENTHNGSIQSEQTCVRELPECIFY